MSNIDSLKRQFRSWIDEHWDPTMPLVAWRTALADSGWAAPDWPEHCYGKGISPADAAALEGVLAEAGVVGAAQTGVRSLAAATILEHGTDEQKRRFLHPILTGEESWCQLFSEPGSGSDLAGATTRADLDGDDWVINGQKVWNTSAHHADWGLLVARTNWDVPKHQGLSYFIIDMHQPGVDVRQLKQMNGYASFNEVFMTDARVPRDNLLGAPGDGWQVAVTTLAHERRGFSRDRSGGRAAKLEGPIFDEYRREVEIDNEPYRWYPQRAGRVDLLISRARQTGAIDDPVLRQDLARVLIMAQTAQWTAARARAAQKAGKPQGPEGSLGKLAASNIARAAARLHTDMSAMDAMLAGPDGAEEGIIAEVLVSVPAVSIAGGTDEIQKNIISERVLGMPKEPRFDTGPFKDVPRNKSSI